MSNRIIKFRAWNKKAKIMTITPFGMTSQPKIDDGHAILMQFTGLLDKNGKEIYERDICKWPSTINREIVWDDRNACFSSRDVMLKAEIGKIAILGHHLEIIGNI